MSEVLKLSDRKFKATVMNMLRIHMEKVNNIQEKMGNASNEIETLRIKRIC